LKNDENTRVYELKKKVADFNRARDWERYHNPKDLVISLCLEVAELLEQFQWKSPGAEEILNNPKMVENLREELADIIIYVLSIANTLDVDLSQTVINKIQKNAEKYPVDKCKGKADKYHKYMGGKLG